MSPTTTGLTVRILLIEPDVVLAQTYAEALRQAGHIVRHTRGAQMAIRLTDEELPDLIVLEPQLARHNGVELLYELRSYTEWQHVPVIVLTQLAPAVFGNNAVLTGQLGVVRIVSKSQTSLQELVDVVSETTVKGHHEPA